MPSLSSVGFGWDVAWRRCVCVFIGIAIAFVLSYLPPKVTQKGTVRRTYSKVIGQVGTAIAQVVSYAHLKGTVSKPPPRIIQNLALLRQKVAKTTPRKAMIAYEPSLRGKWPAELYTALQDLQMELLDLTGQLLGALSALDAKWTQALLQRSQLADPQFRGDLLTALQLVSTALGSSPFLWRGRPADRSSFTQKIGRRFPCSTVRYWSASSSHPSPSKLIDATLSRSSSAIMKLKDFPLTSTWRRFAHSSTCTSRTVYRRATRLSMWVLDASLPLLRSRI